MSKKNKPAKEKGERVWKLLGTGSAVVAGIAATKALNATWKTATGRPAPTTPESPEIAGREAMVWAAASGMAIGMARMYTTRRLASYWARSTGKLPPGMASDAELSDIEKVKQA